MHGASPNVQTRSSAMAPPEIATYRPGDQAHVEAFFRKAWRDARFPFDPAGAHADLRRIPDEYQSSGGEFWLLRVGGGIGGTVGIRRLSADVAEVKRLNVLKQHRGRGFGERLLLEALRHAVRTGFDAARLDTLRIPGPALRLFEKFGFAEIPRYNDNLQAELFMAELARQVRCALRGPFVTRRAGRGMRRDRHTCAPVRTMGG